MPSQKEIKTIKKSEKKSKIVRKGNREEFKSICKNESVPFLLLAYTYYLNNEYTKYISLGYNAKTLEASIVLHHIGKSFVELNCYEYTNVILLSDHIQAYFYPETGVEDSINNRYVNIKFSEFSGIKHVVFTDNRSQQKNHSIRLNYSEWERMQELMGFFSPLTLWYKTTAKDVKKYYNHYVKICCDTNRIRLNNQDFFTPNDVPSDDLTHASVGSPSFNYSRLFYEIPILCRQSILDKCILNLYSPEEEVEEENK